MKQFTIPALSFFEEVIHPQFADLAPGAVGFRGNLNEFTVMDNVASSRPIVDIRRNQNIMQRRDASCDIVYKNLFGASIRKITTTEIYGAVKFCRNEFYQGCLKDFRANDPVFGKKILPYFKSAINTDLTTNAYFGDVDRTVSPTAQFSTDLFDGLFKWLKVYSTAGLIPAGQTIAISGGANYLTTPSGAFDLIVAMHNAMPILMKTFTNDELAFYVSPEIAEAYEKYLIATGQGNTAYIKDIMTGLTTLSYLGIPILKQPLWTAVITDLKGSLGYAAILTIRGNFIFATDKTYGEGEDGKTALIVWYDNEHFTWKYVMFMKAGVQIALPEFVVYAISSWT